MKLLLLRIFLIVFVAIPTTYAFAYRVGNTDINLLTSVREAYDDNITYSENNKRKDYRTDLVLGLTTLTEGKTRRLRFSTHLTQQFFRKFNKFNNLSEDFSVNFTQDISRKSSFSLTNDFAHTQDPRSLEDQFGRTGTRYHYYQNNFSARFTRDIAKQLNMVLNYNNQYYAPSRSDLRSSMLNSGSLETFYSLTSKTAALGVVEFIHRKYEHSISISTNRYAGGIRQYLTTQMYVDARVGKDFAKTSDKQKNDSMFYAGSLVNDVDENTRLSINYSKEDSSTFYTSEIFKSEKVSVSFNRQLLKRLSLAFSGFYGKGEYTLSDTRDTFRGGDARFYYDLSPHLRASCGFAYTGTDSNVDTRDYVKRVISVSLNGDF